MEEGVLYVLPLTGGYALSSIWTASLYHASRESGHRLYLRAIFYAVVLIIICALLHTVFFSSILAYRNDLLGFVSSTFHLNNEHELFGEPSRYLIFCSSALLGPILGHLLNLPKLSFLFDTSRQGRFQKLLLLAQHWESYLLNDAIKNNDFEKLIARSVFTNTPIMFTLEDGKVYVGWTNAAPNPVHARRSVRFLPLMSGYRDSKTHKVTFVTDYYEIFNKISSPECSELNHLSAEDFEVVVPVDRICSSHLFDLVVFNHFESKAAK